MLAYALTSFQSPPELLEVPLPPLGQHDVLIRVQASSINPVDELVGTFAEYVAVPADYFVAAKPGRLTVVEAGTMGLASITSLECLDVLRLSPGDTVFVNRATGGVGSFAVQIAAARGLRVIATARPGPAETYIRDLGAADVVDWTDSDLAAAVLSIASRGVDGMVDLVRRDASAHIGMDETASQRAVAELASAVLRPGARFSSVTNGANADLLERGIGFNVHSEPTLANLSAINALAERGQLRSPVTAEYPFARIAEAFQRQQRAGLGKTAVVMDPQFQRC
jgi:NADPH:quinone reductase-like Zn-dependent oxidoreductase